MSRPREKTTVHSAKELLGSLSAGKKANEDGLKDQPQVDAEQEAPTTHQAESEPADQSQPTEQVPGQNGKEPLPAEDEDEEDFEEEDEEEDFEEEEEQEAEPAFTDQDRADLPVLEANVNQHEKEGAKAIREIRQRKLWMLHRNDDGSRKYTSYDQYVQEVHGRSRQWASEQTQWLAIIEKLAELRAQGVDVPEMLSRHAVSGLCYLPESGNYQGDTQEEQEEAGLIAVLQEAVEDKVGLSNEKLRAICTRRYNYLRRNRWQPKPLAPTYAAYKKDLALLEPLAKLDHIERLNSKVEKWAIDHPADSMPQAVVATYKQHLSLPDNEFLLSAATGDDLESLVADLVALGDKIASTKEAEKAAKDSREKARQARASLGLPSKTRKRGSKPPVPDPEPESTEEGTKEETGTTTYTVVLTGDFAEALGWSAKDEVTHEDLLNLFQTLGDNSSPLKAASNIKVVPVVKEGEKDDDDLDEYEPEEIDEDKAEDVKKPQKPRLLDPADPDAYFPDDD